MIIAILKGKRNKVIQAICHSVCNTVTPSLMSHLKDERFFLDKDKIF